MIFYQYQLSDYLFFLFNICIVTGYVIIALTFLLSKWISPSLFVFFKTRTRWAGALFFVLAAATRGELAWHTAIQKPYLHLADNKSVPFHVDFLHFLQAILIWAFIIFAAIDLTRIGVRDGK